MSKSVKCLAEEPVFILSCIGITNWWANNSDFVWREVTVTKCILNVALLESRAMLNSKTGEKTEGSRTKNRCKLL
jgi:hypothetical protein